MGQAAIEKSTGRVREWCRYGIPASYDATIHDLLDQPEPPPDGTYWGGAQAGWTPLPPRTDAEKDGDLAAFLNTAGGKALKAVVTALVKKGVITLAEIRTEYRQL